MRASIPLILIGAMLLAACGGGEQSPMKDFIGTWKVDYDRSYDLALSYQPETAGDSLGVENYMTVMSKIMELDIREDSLSFTRGKHSRTVPYHFKETDIDTVCIVATVEGVDYELRLSWAEEDFMFIESTATPKPDHFVYRLKRPGEEGPTSPFEGMPPMPDSLKARLQEHKSQ